MVTWVKTGTVDVTNGSTTVIGHGTMFVDEFREGDGFVGPDDRLYEVLNLVSNTQMTLGKGYNGITENGRPYAVIPIQGYLQRTADMLRELTLEAGETISSPNVSALAQAIAAANGVLYFTTSTTMGTAPSQAFGRGLLNLANDVALRNAAGLEPSQAYGRGFLNLADAAAGRTKLALGTAATGTVTTSWADTTANRITKTGDYGWGATGLTDSDLAIIGHSTAFRGFNSTALPTTATHVGVHLQREAGGRALSLVGGDSGNKLYWMNRNSSGAAQPWKEAMAVGDFGIGGYGALVLSTAINSLVTTGFYYCNSANSGENLPVASNGYLLVHAQGPLYTKQTFSHDTDGRTWERFLVNNVWQNWDPVLKGSNVTVSADDIGVGRLLKNGDWGIGATNNAVTVADLNVVAAGGIRRVTPDTTNRPSGLNYGTVVDTMYEKSSENWAQMAMSMTEPRAWIRSRINNAAPAVSEIYTRFNAVGTVSQVSGIPTGAVIERGSNSNGQYVKYADGTMFQWGQVQSASLAVSTTTASAIPFPLPFAGSAPIMPKISVEPYLNWDHYGAIGASSVSSNAMNVFVRNGATTAQQFVIRWECTGRWF
jgi:hypothetical protein